MKIPRLTIPVPRLFVVLSRYSAPCLVFCIQSSSFSSPQSSVHQYQVLVAVQSISSRLPFPQSKISRFLGISSVRAVPLQFIGVFSQFRLVLVHEFHHRYPSKPSPPNAQGTSRLRGGR